LRASGKNRAWHSEYRLCPEYFRRENSGNPIVGKASQDIRNRLQRGAGCLEKDLDDFKKRCFTDAGGQELKRHADNAAHTPFSPYNLRIYKQTCYGISGILAPLVKADRACILSFHAPADEKPVILEICPASTLKAHNLYETDEFRSKEDRPGTCLTSGCFFVKLISPPPCERV